VPRCVPVEQTDGFEFAVNLKAAKLLALMIPEPFPLPADEVTD
jgi:hypothetical protein